MANPTIIQFDGNSGAGDTISMNVPLPSSHSGRRIIELEGIAATAWTDAAKDAGTDWASTLGIDYAEENGYTLNVEKFSAEWMGRLTAQANISKLVPAAKSLNKIEIDSAALAVKNTMINSATSFKKETATMKNWQSSIPAQTLSKESSMAKTSNSRSASKITAPKASAEELQNDISSTYRESVAQLDYGKVLVPVPTWSGNTVCVPVDLEEESTPRFFIIQVLGISSFLGDYGLGKTVKTFSLLPGEETSISMRTWRSTEETISESSSIIDSYDESSSERFAETIQNETTDTATQSESNNWQVEAEVSASWGFGKASASGTTGGESASSTEEFARAANEAVSEHATDASSHRENTVTSSSEASVSSGEETVIERKIKNINVKRTLNFVFRELNQLYQTKIHLKDIKIAFTNGRSGAWREVPLSGLAGLLNQMIKTEADRNLITNQIMHYIGVIFDYKDQPINPIERVEMDACGVKYKSKTTARPDAKCNYKTPPLDMHWFYRFNRDLSKFQEGEDHVVEGVLLKQSDQVLRTDSVIIEALLGLNDALDQYSADLQVETIKEKQLANTREQLAQDIIQSGDATKAQLFEQLFVPKIISEE